MHEWRGGVTFLVTVYACFSGQQTALLSFPNFENRIPSLTTVRIPEGVDDLAIRKALLADYNIEISGGFAELAGKVWRIGLMGYSSRPENVLLLLAAMKKLLAK